MKLFLQNHNIEMYSTHNEGKSLVGERFFRTLKWISQYIKQAVHTNFADSMQ